MLGGTSVDYFLVLCPMVPILRRGWSFLNFRLLLGPWEASPSVLGRFPPAVYW